MNIQRLVATVVFAAAVVLTAAIAAGGLSTAALAQSGEANFWLKGAPNNIQGCIAFDPQFTRKHTFHLVNGAASITSPGGINTKLTLVRPDVYQEQIQQGQLNLTIVADLAATPKTLKVSDSRLGCAWSGVKE